MISLLRQGNEQRGSGNYSLPNLTSPIWDGQCFYGNLDSSVELSESHTSSRVAPLADKAVCVDFNVPFSLVALGLQE